MPNNNACKLTTVHLVTVVTQTFDDNDLQGRDPVEVAVDNAADNIFDWLHDDDPLTPENFIASVVCKEGDELFDAPHGVVKYAIGYQILKPYLAGIPTFAQVRRDIKEVADGD